MASSSSLTPTLIPLAQIVGVTASAFLSGTPTHLSLPEFSPPNPRTNPFPRTTGLIASMSYVTIPTLIPLPAVLAGQTWKRMYDINIATAPPLALTCAVCFGFLSWSGPLSCFPPRSPTHQRLTPFPSLSSARKTHTRPIEPQGPLRDRCATGPEYRALYSCADAADERAVDGEG